MAKTTAGIGIAFQQVLADRFESAESIMERLRDLNPVDDGAGNRDWQEQLAAINDLRNSEVGRRIEANRQVLEEASKRFLSKYHLLLKDSGFVSGGGGPNLVEGGRASVFNFGIVPLGGASPRVGYAHRVEIEDTHFNATISVEGDPPRLYYTGVLADPEGLYEAVEGPSS